MCVCVRLPIRFRKRNKFVYASIGKWSLNSVYREQLELQHQNHIPQKYDRTNNVECSMLRIDLFSNQANRDEKKKWFLNILSYAVATRVN